MSASGDANWLVLAMDPREDIIDLEGKFKVPAATLVGFWPAAQRHQAVAYVRAAAISRTVYPMRRSPSTLISALKVYASEIASFLI